MVRARVLATGHEKASEDSILTARRLIRLPVAIVIVLERNEAPFSIFRWVAWARGPAAQQARLEFVLHCQHARLSRGGWLPEAALGAAFQLWLAVVDEAHRRGLAAPRPDAIPWADYHKAIVERPKGRRRQAPLVAPDAERAAEERARAEPAAAVAESPPAASNAWTVLMVATDLAAHINSAIRNGDIATAHRLATTLASLCVPDGVAAG
jgi:hypothetical protein